jgi:hypothetical protein
LLYPPGIFPGVPAQQRRRRRETGAREVCCPGTKAAGCYVRRVFLLEPIWQCMTRLAIWDDCMGGLGPFFGAILGVGDSFLVNLEPFSLILGPYYKVLFHILEFLIAQVQEYYTLNM